MIGGNITGQIQLCKTETNIIGSCDKTWETVDDITGYLDLSTGDSKYTTSVSYTHLTLPTTPYV